MHPLLKLAKTTVETHIKEGKIISPPKDLPKEFLKKKSGVFVTIENNGQLRGCIGTYLPTKENIAEEIIHNAIASATQDHRFEKIQEKELPLLSYTVSVLSKPAMIRDLKELNPKKYGIIVMSQGFMPGSDAIFSPAPKINQKTGLLLPDLEGIDTTEKQISIACQKAGIDPKEENIIIYRFTVQKYTQ